MYELILQENSFYIETYGCASNKADSYIISNALKKSNYTLTSLEDAQFVIVNTCAVKEQTENKIKARLKTLYEQYSKNSDKYIIIAGCLPYIAPDYIEVVKNIVPTFSAIIDLDNIHEIPQIFQEIKKGKKNLIIKSEQKIDKAEFYIDHEPGKITGIIPISEGCLGSCTYCCVKNARGKLNCYNPEKIVENIEYQLKQGIKQIYLTSQDCSTYRYNSTQLSDLVKQIVNLDFKFFLRIGMINPCFLVDDFNQLLSLFKLNKVYQFLHIPIQSGSNRILKLMKRKYLISDIINKIRILRENFPNLTISTDIICGFPGESENDFDQTIDLINWLKPEILNISKFTARPGTKAKDMKQLDSKIIKERSIRLTKVFRNSLIDMNKKWKDWEGEILLLHKSSIPNQAFGRNIAYKNIFIDNFKGNFGNFVKVKINKVDGFNLFGKLL